MTVNGAGNAPARSRMERSFADSTVKLPEIWPEPPMIGSRITGAEITLLSSTMANGPPDVLGGDLAELARTRHVEAEIDDRLVGALVETRLRIDEIAARHDHALLDQVRLLPLLLRAVEDFGLRRRPSGKRLLHRHGLIDQAEVELGGLAEQLLETRACPAIRAPGSECGRRPGAGSPARRCRAGRYGAARSGSTARPPAAPARRSRARSSSRARARRRHW